MQLQKDSCVREVDHVLDGVVASSLLLVAIVWCFDFFCSDVDDIKPLTISRCLTNPTERLPSSEAMLASVPP